MTHHLDTLVSNVMTVCLDITKVVQAVLVKSNSSSISETYKHFIGLLKDCACNTVGTFGSSACSDSSGVCTCDSSAYSGDKCDDCIDGYYLSGDGSTCVGKIKPIF